MKKAELHFSSIILFLITVLMIIMVIESLKLYLMQSNLKFLVNELARDLEISGIQDIDFENRKIYLQEKLNLEDANVILPQDKIIQLNQSFKIEANLDYQFKFFNFNYPIYLEAKAYGKSQTFHK